MSMHQQIQYVIWGTKRGVDNFFCSPDLDIASIEIQNTLKDIRSVANFPETKIDFYSLEFTTLYKVFSQYRTLNDRVGRPGFMAITLYIPHPLKIKNKKVLDVLNEVTDLYWNLYVNENTRKITEEREDRQLFHDRIAAIELVQDVDTLPDKSLQNDKLALVRYKNTDELNTYFNFPYQDAYFQFQEIVFIRDNINRSFSSMTLLENIKPTHPKYSILVKGDFEHEKSVYRVNNKEVTHFKGLELSDIVSMRLTKPFHKPLFINETVQSLVQKSHLPGKVIEYIIDATSFIPVCKTIYLSFKEKASSVPLPSLSGSITINGILQSNRSSITLCGNQLSDTYKLAFKAEGYLPVLFDIEVCNPIYEDENSTLQLEIESIKHTTVTEPDIDQTVKKQSIINETYHKEKAFAHKRHHLNATSRSIEQELDNETRTKNRLKEMQDKETFIKESFWKSRVLRYVILVICGIAIGAVSVWLILKVFHHNRAEETPAVYKFEVNENGPEIEKIDLLNEDSLPKAKRPVIEGDSVVVSSKNKTEIKLAIKPKSEYYKDTMIDLLGQNETIKINFVLKEEVQEKVDTLCGYLKLLNDINITNKNVIDIKQWMIDNEKDLDFYFDNTPFENSITIDLFKKNIDVLYEIFDSLCKNRKIDGKKTISPDNRGSNYISYLDGNKKQIWLKNKLGSPCSPRDLELLEYIDDKIICLGNIFNPK